MPLCGKVFMLLDYCQTSRRIAVSRCIAIQRNVSRYVSQSIVVILVKIQDNITCCFIFYICLTDIYTK